MDSNLNNADNKHQQTLITSPIVDTMITTKIADDNNNNKESLNKKIFEVNADDLNKKKLEISLNRLPETSSIYVNNSIDYSSPLQMQQVKSAVEETKPVNTKTVATTTEPTEAVKQVASATYTVTTETETSKLRCNISSSLTNLADITANENLQLNTSDFKKVDTVVSYGRPPPSAPRKSIDSKLSTTSLLRQYEQVPYTQISRVNSCIKDGCHCNNQQNNCETTALANNRVVQAASIYPNITRICIRNIDADANFDYPVNQLHDAAPNENLNKKWNEYYDAIRVNDNNFYNNRKKFENDDANSQRNTAQQHHSVPDCKNKSCSELRHKRIEKLKQEDVICEDSVVERVCKNTSNELKSHAVRDQECQFPTPCARCVHNKKVKIVQNTSPLLEEPKYQTTETQTQAHIIRTGKVEVDEVQTEEDLRKFFLQLVKESQQKRQELQHKQQQQQRQDQQREKSEQQQTQHQDATPFINKVGKKTVQDDFYQFLTPSFNENQNLNKPKENDNKQKKAVQHMDNMIQTSSTPSVNCENSNQSEFVEQNSSIDKATNTASSLACESKTIQCPSPSFRKTCLVTNDKQCQYPTYNPKQQPTLKKYAIDEINETIVDFNSKNTPSYQKFLKRVEPNAVEEIPMQDFHHDAKPIKSQHANQHVKFSDLSKKDVKNVSVLNHEKVPIILPSKQMQTFYNGLKIWQTPRDLIVIGDSMYPKVDENQESTDNADMTKVENINELKSSQHEIHGEADRTTMKANTDFDSIEYSPLNQSVLRKRLHKKHECQKCCLLLMLFVLFLIILGVLGYFLAWDFIKTKLL